MTVLAGGFFGCFNVGILAVGDLNEENMNFHNDFLVQFIAPLAFRLSVLFEFEINAGPAISLRK